MKVFASFCLIFLFSVSSSFGQEFLRTQINKVDEAGKRQGYWRVYDGNGNLKFEGEFSHGIPVGQFKYYYPTGKIQAVINNYDEGRIAYSKAYHPSGRIMAEGKYVDQKKDSTWRYYSDEDGSLVSEEYYVDKKKEGTWKTYYPEGGVAEEITYHNNVKDGPWIQYFTDGKKKSEGTYVNDQLQGRYVIYHLNGNVEVSGQFKDSNKDGVWMYLNEIGEKQKMEVYNNGRLAKTEEYQTEDTEKK